MYVTELSVDYNGLVLFDPVALRAHYGGSIAEGTDLFTRYITTQEGDEVLAAGLIVPVLAIDDAGYQVVVRLSSEPAVQEPIIVENGTYALRVEQGLVLADLAVLREWIDGLGWNELPARKGNYAVTVRGFRGLDPLGTEITSAGYEFVLTPADDLPPVSADTGKNMRVLVL